ncbi:MAG: hypothetical protein ACOY81_06470, partial [Bacillota bacterium]
MKTVITIVGTSLFTNYQHPDVRSLINILYNNKYIDISTDMEVLTDRPADQMNSFQGYCQTIEKAIKRFWLKNISRTASHPYWQAASGNQPNLDACAELTSTGKIARELKEDLQVHLLATDTILSCLAAKILRDNFADISFGSFSAKFLFNPEQDVIKNLQVYNRQNFSRHGLRLLVQRLMSVIESCGGNCVLNITGGYKAIIPYLTIIGQVNSIPIYYIFEESSELIALPQVPLTIDWHFMGKYAKEFSQLAEAGTDQSSAYSYQFRQECASCLEEEDHMLALSPLGELLWKKSQEKYFFFYAPDKVWEEIQSQPDILRIIRQKLPVYIAQKNKTEKKANGHLVYDDGSNPYRINYFVEKGSIY